MNRYQPQATKAVMTLTLTGTLEQGCAVQLTVTTPQERAEYTASLSGDRQLAMALQQHWQTYRQLYTSFRGLKPLKVDTGKQVLDIQVTRQSLVTQFNQWLNQDSFRVIENAMRDFNTVHRDSVLAIRSDAVALLKLPWSKWQLTQGHFPLVIKFLPLNTVTHLGPTNPQKISKILMVLGKADDLKIHEDHQAIAAVMPAGVTVLKEPSLSQLHDYLWEQGWDLFIFSGHSQTQDEGQIKLNSEEFIAIELLENGVKAAIKHGLKGAIFNSCDGIGLAQKCEQYGLQKVVAMQEWVPDTVAQVFLKHLMTHFRQGLSFDQAFIEAQKRLQKLEDRFPDAQLLPFLYEKPQCRPWIYAQPLSPWQLAQQLTLKASASTTFVLGLRWLGLLTGLELGSYDHLMKQRPEEIIDSRLVVVEITEADTNQYEYPILDSVLDQTLEILINAQPAAIGIDIHRNKFIQPDAGQNILDHYQNDQNLVTVCAYDTTDANYNAHPDIPPAQVAFSNVPLDRDQVTRRYLLSYDGDLVGQTSFCHSEFSLGWQLAYRYLWQTQGESLTLNDDQNWQFQDAIFKRLPARFGAYQQPFNSQFFPTGNSAEILINYRANSYPGKRLTLTNLLENPPEPGSFEGKIVLVGYGEQLPDEQFMTPIGSVPGVWIHASVASQMISHALDGRSPLRAFSFGGDGLIVFWGAWVSALFLGGLKYRFPAFGKGVMISGLGGILVVTYLGARITFMQGYWLPLIPCQLAIVGVVILLLLPADLSLKQPLKSP
ncbi:MAG: CHASE2 domain-containing protein [Synechocystis sp.]|nr:CHASE2 domain-containing protein [Synechocystis sp.]